ncbi:MAG: SusC/RagA family TonB-linked outer membrane protein, partial [Draconibacterium sp.]|nr:SusC/RagA family TonB-linked outer membrane protein [Draconibacterium sp.]
MKKKLLRLICLLMTAIFISSVALAQQKSVTGTVTDSANEPLPGVSIVVKGTTSGTVTNVDGFFNLNVPANAETLLFSFIGMKIQEVEIGNQTTINVTLEPVVIGLEEVIAVGYGTMKKRDLTGTVSRVTTDKTIDLPNLNVLQSLKGNVPGLSVGTPDRAGEEPSLKIRGTNSLSAGNKPLVVVDGIIYNGSLNSIDINDIESVDVLKDASAAAVYGSRSANGVLIITTKKGLSEKPILNFSASYGVANPVDIAPVLSPDEYLQKILDYRVATGQEANPANIADYLTVTEANNLAAGKTIDWQKELIQTAPTQNYVASISGNTEKTNYYISASYYQQEGIVENDDFDRLTSRINLSTEITDWFKVSVKSSFANMDYSGEQVGWYQFLSPYSNWYEGGADSGSLEEYPMEDPYFRHPYINPTIDDHDVRTDLFGLFSSEIKVPFVQGLKWTTNFSLNQRTNRKYRFVPNTIAKTTNGQAYKRIQSYFDWTLDNIVNYNRTFNDVHSVDATFLFSREYQRADITQADASNFFNQALGYHSLEMGAVPTVSSGYGEQNQDALMGRLNYIYNSTYALTGTIRRDGFSGFAEGNKYATFYSGAFALTMSNEAFMQVIDWLDRLK